MEVLKDMLSAASLTTLAHNSSKYLLDNSAPQTPVRFAGLQTLYDERTFAAFERVGATSGWRCLEIGAGGGSVTRWLAEKVGPSGFVLATDLDTRWLTQQTWPPHVTIERHDVTLDPLDEGSFDLIHTRLVLVHLQDIASVVERLARALKPGGWLVLEEFDGEAVPACLDLQLPHAQLLNKVRTAFCELMRSRRQELLAGRRLPWVMRNLHLDPIDVQGHVAFYGGGSPGAELECANFHQIRDQLIGRAGVTSADLDRCIEVLRDRSVVANLPLLVTISGRKPEN